jgi:ankyrin repeat protein
MLLKAGANPNIQDHKKVTPLMVAAGQRNTKIVTMLIAAGADIRLKSKSGKTAYDYNQEAMQEYAMNAFFTRGALT